MVFVQVVLTVVASLIISLASDASTAHLPFNPREYPKKVVSCPAINRAENTRVDIELRTCRLYSSQCSTRRKQSLIRNIRRLCQHQPQSRKNAAFLARVAKSMGELEISDTGVSGCDRQLHSFMN
jgi:hypothetical protein